MPRFRVACPLGVVAVVLERSDLDLGERGGFEARWADEEDGALSLELFRQAVKAHLRECYRRRHGSDPGNIALNLASHQLVDDLIGWTRLNPQKG